MNSKLSFILLLALGVASGQQYETVIGREFYNQGDFKKAAAHFQLALHSDPSDAEASYWAGMSYQALADIAGPLSHGYRTKARLHLTRAAELAPDRLEYRHELFEFLLDSAGSSRSTRQQASAILQAMPESDPEYMWMQRRIGQAKHDDLSAEARLGRIFLAGPGAIYRIVELPASALSLCHKSLHPGSED